MSLILASPELKADKEVVLAAVRQNGYALSFASPTLQGDKNVVLAAIQQNGEAFQFASPELKADRVVVLAAVKKMEKHLSMHQVNFRKIKRLY